MLLLSVPPYLDDSQKLDSHHRRLCMHCVGYSRETTGLPVDEGQRERPSEYLGMVDRSGLGRFFRRLHALWDGHLNPPTRSPARQYRQISLLWWPSRPRRRLLRLQGHEFHPGLRFVAETRTSAHGCCVIAISSFVNVSCSGLVSGVGADNIARYPGPSELAILAIFPLPREFTRRTSGDRNS